MAGAPTATTSSAATAYTPSWNGVYGNNQLPAQVGIPSGLFNGLGPAALYQPSNLQLQTYTPDTADINSILSQLSVQGHRSPDLYQKLQSIQNSNLAGYNATNVANAKNAGFLQQAAIAQNRLLGELNSRGLLNSYEQGGAGTADMQQLQNALNSAAVDQGAGLQSELNGLTANDAMYQMALQNYNNEISNFNQYQNSKTPGLTDIAGLGFSALPLIPGI